MTQVFPSANDYQTRQVTDVQHDWPSVARDVGKHGTIEIRGDSHVVAYMVSPDAYKALLEAASAWSSACADKAAALNSKYDAQLAGLKAPDLAEKLEKVLDDDGLPKSKRKAGSTF